MSFILSTEGQMKIHNKFEKFMPGIEQPQPWDLTILKQGGGFRWHPSPRAAPFVVASLSLVWQDVFGCDWHVWSGSFNTEQDDVLVLVVSLSNQRVVAPWLRSWPTTSVFVSARISLSPKPSWIRSHKNETSGCCTSGSDLHPVTCLELLLFRSRSFLCPRCLLSCVLLIVPLI